MPDAGVDAVVNCPGLGARDLVGDLALTPGTGGQAGSRSAGSSGRPTSARIRWLIASVIPKVSH
jgi:hypothetical protein